MVGSIDIQRLNLEELLGVVTIYPWYAGARMELCRRMQRSGGLSEQQTSQAALYLGSRRLLSELVRSASDYSDSSIGAAYEEPAAAETAPSPATLEEARRIFVVGGDYFSASQYKEAKRTEDNVFAGFANSGKEVAVDEMPDEGFSFYTETLGQIYAEQGYLDEAKQIYSKLSLRYPEKSVYFAALIEKLDKK